MAHISDYARSLSNESKLRYLEKLRLMGGQDPFALEKKDLILSLDELPRITITEITDFLIFRVSPFTQKEIRAYKSLDAFAHMAARWVEDIKAIKIDTCYCVLGKVMHSQKINEVSLNVWITFSGKGEILASHCNCVAGLGEACTHVTAILFTLEYAGKERKSVTDVLAYWIGPKSKKTFFKKIVDTNFSAKVTQDVPPPKKSSDYPVPILSSLEAQNFLKDYKTDGGISVLNLFFEDVVNNSDTSIVLTDLFKVTFRDLSLAELKDVASSITLFLDGEQIKKIEIDTRKQSRNKEWFLFRAGRITASNFKSICHTKIDSPSISLLKKICYPHLYKRTFNAGIYGCEHEKMAIKDFENYHKSIHPDSAITKCGLFLNEKYPYFAATPDGILNCEVCGIGCVEVKCPYCARDTSISELIKTKKTCLKTDNATILDRKHQYFYQIQMQMALSKLDFCFFVLWSKEDFYFELVKFDITFWQEKSDIALNDHRCDLFD